MRPIFGALLAIVTLFSYPPVAKSQTVLPGPATITTVDAPLSSDQATRLFQDGMNLSAADAQKFADDLNRDAGNSYARATLMGYYVRGDHTPEALALAAWCIEQAPDSELASFVAHFFGAPAVVVRPQL